MKILVLGASAMQLPIIRRAKELGHTTIVADYDASAIGFSIADVKLLFSTNDITSLLKAAKKHCIDAVLTTSDYPVRSVAAIAESMQLFGPSSLTAEICTNKFLQREILSKAGLRVPKYQLVNHSDNIEIPFDFPVVVKPIDSSASRGVMKVDSKFELQSAIDYAIQYSFSGQVIIEEFLSGREFSVEVLAQNGCHIIAITEKRTTGEGDNFFVEEQHIIPADINDREDILIREIVSSAIAAIGMNHSPSHMEVMLTMEGPVVIEIAARLGGDYITSDLVPLSTGIDMLENQIRISLGQRINTQEKLKNFSGIRFLTPDNYEFASKKIKILLDDSCLIKWEQVPIQKGTPHSLRSSFDRLGYWIVCADNRESLLDALSY